MVHSLIMHNIRNFKYKNVLNNETKKLNLQPQHTPSKFDTLIIVYLFKALPFVETCYPLITDDSYTSFRHSPVISSFQGILYFISGW